MGGGHDDVLHKLTEEGKRRRWAVFKKTWLNGAVLPVAVIVTSACIAISFFTIRLFKDNNTVSLKEKGKRGHLYYTPAGNLIKSEDQKARHESKRKHMNNLNDLEPSEVLVKHATIANKITNQ